MCNIFATDYLENLKEKNKVKELNHSLTSEEIKKEKILKEQDRLLWSEKWYLRRNAYNTYKENSHYD